MPVPTSITDLDPTAANNSPAGSDAIGTSLDDYLRSHAAIIRQAYDALVVVDGTLLPKAGGSVTGTITTTHQIKGITPVANEDLARKDYVDTMLPKAGGTVTGQIKGITPVADEDLARKDYVDSVLSSGVASSGSWTPSVTLGTNCASSSFQSGSANYMKIGNVVTFMATFDVRSTASGDCKFQLTLPINPGMTNFYECVGSGVRHNAPLVLVGVTGAGTSSAEVRFNSPDATSAYVSIRGTYYI